MENRRVAHLTQDDIRRLSKRKDTVVYETEYTTVFTPWEDGRVRSVIRKLRSISINCDDEEEAREAALKDPELREFSNLYQTMFKVLCNPAHARSEETVKTLLAFVDLQAKLRAGEVTDQQARASASDTALAGILRQMPNAPQPPASSIEELD